MTRKIIRLSHDAVTASFRIPPNELKLLSEYAIEKEVSRNSVILQELRRFLKRVGKLQ